MTPICITCSSPRVCKSGYNAQGTQRYKCRECGDTFTLTLTRPPCPKCRSRKTKWNGYRNGIAVRRCVMCNHVFDPAATESLPQGEVCQEPGCDAPRTNGKYCDWCARFHADVASYAKSDRCKQASTAGKRL